MYSSIYRTPPEHADPDNLILSNPALSATEDAVAQRMPTPLINQMLDELRARPAQVPHSSSEYLERYRPLPKAVSQGRVPAAPMKLTTAVSTPRSSERASIDSRRTRESKAPQEQNSERASIDSRRINMSKTSQEQSSERASTDSRTTGKSRPTQEQTEAPIEEESQDKDRENSQSSSKKKGVGAELRRLFMGR